MPRDVLPAFLWDFMVDLESVLLPKKVLVTLSDILLSEGWSMSITKRTWQRIKSGFFSGYKDY